ncbi:hypothetical protein ACO0K9_26470 [Undibacterium sp. Ji50W]|uniref:hypothetical protein n=1 Tax=Undibacterium sp. Ji50W TaxID=3413041 RepID=UPI003BF34FDC
MSLLATGFAGWSSTASATGSNCSARGITCISGGIGEPEREELRQQAGQYSLWISTAAKKSGAFLSDTKITVRDSKNHQVVLTTTMDGPLLFLGLPAGQYEVEAIFYEKTMRIDQQLKKLTTIKPPDHHQMMFYFDVPDIE